MGLPEFEFYYISAGTGTSGTTGDMLEVDWTHNFGTIKDLIVLLDADIQKRILSNEIQQIKVENNIAYFTTDNGTTWISLGPSFANLAGNPDDNAALVLKFSNYTTNSQFTELATRVGLNENNITVLSDTVTILSSDVTEIKSQIDTPVSGILARLTAVEVSNNKKISSSSVIEIKEVSPGNLEYTDDGETWHPVAALTGVDWGQIGGDISNQADLLNKFDLVYDAIAAVTTQITETSTQLTEHMENVQNPHAVSASQVGLGNVDNTSDINKPVSTAQQEAINLAASNAANALKIEAVTKAQYDAIVTKDANTNYRIIDINQ